MKDNQPKLRPTTQEEKDLHAKEINTIRADYKICEEGFKSGYITKSQLKKAKANAHNRINSYINTHGLFIIKGVVEFCSDESTGTSKTSN